MILPVYMCNGRLAYNLRLIMYCTDYLIRVVESMKFFYTGNYMGQLVFSKYSDKTYFGLNVLILFP